MSSVDTARPSAIGWAFQWRSLRRLRGLLLTLPMSVYFALFAPLPLGILFLYSFFTDGFYAIEHVFTLENYQALVKGDSGQVFTTVLIRTYTLALTVMVISLLLGFPTAYFISRHLQRWRTVAFILLFVPLSTSYLVKVYAWRGVLDSKGIVNYLLIEIGVIDQPLDFLIFNRFAVGLALVSAALPFMVLPIYSALERIPGNLLEAARDLGAGGGRVFWQVIVPLSRRGIVAGCTFVFIICFGDFIASQLLGGASGILVGKVIYSSFGLADDWPYGAAMAFAVLLVAGLTIAALSRIAGGGRGNAADVTVDGQLSR